MAPAIVHDFLYWEQPCTKDEADAVMYLAMKQAGMTDFSVNRVYDGTRTPFAQSAWDRNRVARSEGEPRFFNDAFMAKLVSGNIDPKATLSSIQADAVRNNGTNRPVLSIATVRAACQSALREFTALRAL